MHSFSVTGIQPAPFFCIIGPFGGKFTPHKLDFIVETVAFQSVHIREKEMFLFQSIDN